MFVRLLLAALACLLIPAVGYAQPTTATVVTGCGTPTSTYPAGAIKPVTQDTTGTLCTSGSGGGGGGGSVTQGTVPWQDQLVAGTAIIGKVGIDQTTPGNTNGVQVNAALPAGTNLIGKTGIDQTTIGTTNGVTLVPIAISSGNMAPVVSASAEAAHVLKGSGGNAYSASATNLTATAGFLVLLNLTASPADGAIAPLACAPLPANGSASISYGDFPAVFSTGITAVVTSAATCFTKTTGTVTAFISGQVR